MNAIKRIIALENELRAVREVLAETNRRLANIIRLGTVESAHERSVNVKTGTNLAKNVPFFVPAAGRVRHYRRPTVGEQCILINIGDGDNLNNAVSLMGLRSNQFSFPTLKENEVMTDYGGGMTELYNLDKGSITCNYPGGMFLTCDIWQDGHFEATGEVKDHTRTMQEDRDIFNGHDHLSPETKAPTSKPRQKQ
ncbi:phage baseplate assembly protein V [Vibrio anguillarum]|uniref:phage baseplate assembly protein V n=1 Tax=Vibrio anguillarum TaxID=55601 RepID=UPI001C9D4FEF|nr:phage baseplate assembly protein V [Vibrio anguillarum]MBY7667264.1 phage baseplate assembly protein V [Vibrio anguillarum]